MTDLFNSDDETTPVDQNKDYLAELVGEDKKFKTPADLAKGKAESDAFIEQLKSELSGLRQELNTRLKLEEVVDRISSSNKSPSSELQQKAPEQDISESAITPEKVQELVSQTLSNAEKAAQRVKNTTYVAQKLQEAFGPAFSRTIKEQTRKLGIGEEFAKNLAAEQPEAFLKLFDVVPQQEVSSTATGAPRSSVNSSGFKPEAGTKRKSFYDDMRRKEPARYWSVAVQNEIHREAHKQGESFFDK